jgi:hypothetical protein
MEGICTGKGRGYYQRVMPRDNCKRYEYVIQVSGLDWGKGKECSEIR